MKPKTISDVLSPLFSVQPAEPNKTIPGAYPHTIRTVIVSSNELGDWISAIGSQEEDQLTLDDISKQDGGLAICAEVAQHDVEQTDLSETGISSMALY